METNDCNIVFMARNSTIYLMLSSSKVIHQLQKKHLVQCRAVRWLSEHKALLLQRLAQARKGVTQVEKRPLLHFITWTRWQKVTIFICSLLSLYCSSHSSPKRKVNDGSSSIIRKALKISVTHIFSWKLSCKWATTTTGPSLVAVADLHDNFQENI